MSCFCSSMVLADRCAAVNLPVGSELRLAHGGDAQGATWLSSQSYHWLDLWRGPGTSPEDLRLGFCDGSGNMLWGMASTASFPLPLPFRNLTLA